MRLYTTIGIIGIMGSIVGVTIGICMAEFLEWKDLDKLWLVIPCALTGWAIGAWVEIKSYKDISK